jgi:hypothetical protein
VHTAVRALEIQVERFFISSFLFPGFALYTAPLETFPMERMVIAMNYYPGSAIPANDSAARASIWRRFRPAAADRHISLLFWLTVLGLGCVSVLTVTWGASSILARKGAEKLLHVERLFPKLKGTHGERKADAFHMSEPESSELAHPKERTTQAPLLPAVIDHPKGAIVQTPQQADGPEPPRLASLEPGLHLIAQVELTPPPLVETCDDPIIYVQQCTIQRGDSPMMRNWKTLTMYALLSAAAVAFTPQPAVVFATEKNQPAKADKLSDADKEAIAGILRQELKKLEEGVLATLQKRVDTLEGKVSALQLEQLRHQVEIDKLTKRLDAASASPVVDKAMMDALKAIHDGIAKLAPPEKRSSAYPPNGTATNMGRVMLVNNYSDKLLFIINGVGHRLPAYSSKLVEQIPVGTVGIEVFSERFGRFHSQPTTLAGGDTFTLTANPQR